MLSSPSLIDSTASRINTLVLYYSIHGHFPLCTDSDLHYQ